jgi:tetratricopeptide (TPR) repeat protein
LRSKGDITAALEALEAYREAFEIEPPSPGLIFELAETLWLSGDITGAEEAFNRSMQLNNRDWGLVRMAQIKEFNSNCERWLGIIMCSRGELAQALVHFKSAAKKGPAIRMNQYELASLLLELRDYNSAIQVFRRVLTIDRNDIDAQQGIQDCISGKREALNTEVRPHPQLAVYEELVEAKQKLQEQLQREINQREEQFRSERIERSLRLRHSASSE